MAISHDPKLSRPLSAPRGWWPVALRKEADGLHVSIAWTRLAVLLVLGAVGGWLGLGVGAFLWVKYHRGFTEARLVDILWPSRWDEYRVARGNFYIRQARREIAAQQWGDAIHHLRVGVGAAPANTEGRVDLARFYLLAGRIELAERTLVDGLAHAGDNPDYLRTLFAFLLQYQEDDEVRRIAATLLPPVPEVTPRNQLIAIAAAHAELFRGNFDAAEALVRRYELLRTTNLDGRLLLARIEWERGRRERAFELLKAYAVEFPASEEFYAQLTAYYHEAGQEAAAEKYALLRTLANPRSAAAHIDLIRTYRRNHKLARYQEDVDSLLRDFARDRAALDALLEFGTEAGDPELTQRVYRLLQSGNQESDTAALMVAESYLAAGRYQAGLEFIGDVGRARPEWRQRFAGIITGLQAVAYFGLGQRDDGELYLGQFLKQTNLRAENYTAIANRLLGAGAAAEARRILAPTVAANPRNQAALTRLVEIDLAQRPGDELVANLRRLLTMRRSPTELLLRARTRLASDRCLFLSGRDELLAALDAALAAASLEREVP